MQEPVVEDWERPVTGVCRRYRLTGPETGSRSRRNERPSLADGSEAADLPVDNLILRICEADEATVLPPFS
jgi:hypothetical protein